MNSFGRLFRISIFGESHGKNIGTTIDGCPAGLPISEKDFAPDLKRRQAGRRGTSHRRELDIPRVISGIFNSRTTGSPVTIIFENQDIRSGDYTVKKDLPRPGHADLAARQKYRNFNDYRGSGHFSGRLTAPLVAAGVIAKKLIFPAMISASVTEIGGSREIEKAVNSALKKQDSIGGIVECCTNGLPAGWGEPFFDSVESQISHLAFAVPGIKGIEFGSGFACSRMTGSQCNDIIIDKTGKTKSNHSGGINGGITNSNELFFRIAVKPPSSIKKEQKTINLKTGKSETISVQGRHDACIALRLPVIIEAVTAVVLADFCLISQL